ncbi:hypothetical protein DSC45_28440 [Streptomyces sp. YIM 130001]|nr:hypothetical protein DSC45_28440 [Streptomyces sp. YIM 130001]
MRPTLQLAATNDDPAGHGLGTAPSITTTTLLR